jgi:hypothetical protein
MTSSRTAVLGSSCRSGRREIMDLMRGLRNVLLPRRSNEALIRLRFPTVRYINPIIRPHPLCPNSKKHPVSMDQPLPTPNSNPGMGNASSPRAGNPGPRNAPRSRSGEQCFDAERTGGSADLDSMQYMSRSQSKLLASYMQPICLAAIRGYDQHYGVGEMR